MSEISNHTAGAMLKIAHPLKPKFLFHISFSGKNAFVHACFTWEAIAWCIHETKDSGWRNAKLVSSWQRVQGNDPDFLGIVF